MKEYLWVERYRPHTIGDIILPARIKETLQGHVRSGDLSNLLLVGGPGVGKTTAARAMVEELGSEYLMVNSSMHGNIDTLRDEIAGFASSLSFEGGRKYVILDEADGLNPNSTQKALRAFMEEFSANCGFIFTCNFKEKIIEALRSRLAEVNFSIPKQELPGLAKQFMDRSVAILNENGVAHDPLVVVEIIKKHIPDWRRILGELQHLSKSGGIDTRVLSQAGDSSVTKLMGFIKEKNFTEVRKWVAENDDIGYTELFRMLYTQSLQMLETKSIPAIVLILAKYNYQAAFSTDQQINTTAALVEFMVEARFK